MCLSLMSQGLLYPQQVPLVLQVLKQVSVAKQLKASSHLMHPLLFIYEYTVF